MTAQRHTFASTTLLLVRDIERSAGFYERVLGYEEPGFWGEPPGFCMLHRGPFDLMLQLAEEPNQVAPKGRFGVWDMHLRVADLAAERAAIEAAGGAIVSECGPTEYGMLEMCVDDPDGYRILSRSRRATPCEGRGTDPRQPNPGPAPNAARPFLPTKDFNASKAFYEALGFTKLLDGDVAILSAGSSAIILQRRYSAEWAENCMMQLMVDDLDGWWSRLQALDLPKRFDVQPPKPPAMQPWGLRVAYVCDPAGVLWHICERRKNNPAD